MSSINFFRQHVPPEKISRVVAEKWRMDVLAEGFLPFPKRLLRSTRQLLGDTDELQELTVLLGIIDFRGSGKETGPSRDYLAFLCGMSPTDLMRALERLNRKGLLTWREVSTKEREMLLFDLSICFDRIVSIAKQIDDSKDDGNTDFPF